MLFSKIGQFELSLVLAVILGAVIGAEREWQQKIAGIKTNALVSLGAAMFILMSERITGDSSGAGRVAANIVTGIGFLGAGAIMREGMNIIGINTAATLWCSGAIGALTGLGFYYESSIGTIIIVVTNIILRAIHRKLNNRIINRKTT